MPNDSMIPQRSSDWTLLDRYFLGYTTPEENETVQRLFEHDPRLAVFAKTLRTPAFDEPLLVDLSALKQKIYERRVAETRPARKQWFRGRVSSGPTRWYTLGAIVASTLLVFTGWQVGRYNPRHPSAELSTYATGEGERATITLPDGSTILMNVASRVQVPANYSADNRTIQLTGEALFTVAPRAGTPFTVVSGHSVTRVLGTKFVVRRYETDTAATIAVRDGKVAVGSVILTAGQATSVTARGSSAVRPAESRQFSFAQGLLEFDNERLPDAIPLLNRWYNAEIRFGDSTFVDQRVVGAFEAGSLTDLVSILEFTFKARVVRDGRVLTLYRGR